MRVTSLVDREAVVSQVEEWRARLEDLYGTIEDYHSRLPEVLNTRVFRGSILQAPEPPLSQFRVAPQMLPTLAIVSDQKRLSFVPSALWIVGAQGRVDVGTGDRRFVLLDLGKENTPDWQLVTSRTMPEHAPFDYHIFHNLLLHGVPK